MASIKHKNTKRIEGQDKNVWVAAEPSIVNLGQGYPDIPPPSFLFLTTKAIIINTPNNPIGKVMLHI
uniref:Uncharacterized protein n=1 Tax=Cyprinus carpio TaxID=7962 RepID=A0A8C2H5N3_CYPCA